ncbi:acyltransferase [Hymenobacter sp. BT770]|uniref:acyltransferase family protein n=1 Tax=Hymenobacter sp. BT770 TaxID=2886942 RepID=UPI001D0F70DD|nr:acyltransferase [Hymenobacter sp. BT770]MCC3152698.1 acyltransferase [Hymenobacter sp. BT770]MDO3414771.1 acyltransferase [Hymenobacter sp. BT770]
MEPEPRQSPVRFYELDALRFVAALSVVCFHYTYRPQAPGNFSPLAFPELDRVTRYGFLGVELFFLISGYVVLLSARGKTVRQFLLARVTRLYPAFWTACTLTFLVLLGWGAGTGAVSMPAGLRADAGRYVYNMTMLHEFLGAWPLDGVYWSLTVELTFYFLVSLLLAYRLLPHVDWVLAGWLAYTAWVGFGPMTATPFERLFFPRYAPFFAAGMLFSLLQPPAGRTWFRYALLLAAYGLALHQTFYRAIEQTSAFHDDVSRKVCLVVVTGCFLLMGGVAFRWLNLSRFSWLTSLGALTYPLYLLHGNIGFVVFHRLGPSTNKYALVGSTLAAMLVASYLLHVWVEQPLRRSLGRGLAQAVGIYRSRAMPAQRKAEASTAP